MSCLEHLYPQKEGRICRFGRGFVIGLSKRLVNKCKAFTRLQPINYVCGKRSGSIFYRFTYMCFIIESTINSRCLRNDRCQLPYLT